MPKIHNSQLIIVIFILVHNLKGKKYFITFRPVCSRMKTIKRKWHTKENARYSQRDKNIKTKVKFTVIFCLSTTWSLERGSLNVLCLWLCSSTLIIIVHQSFENVILIHSTTQNSKFLFDFIYRCHSFYDCFRAGLVD